MLHVFVEQPIKLTLAGIQVFTENCAIFLRVLRGSFSDISRVEM